MPTEHPTGGPDIQSYKTGEDTARLRGSDNGLPFDLPMRMDVKRHLGEDGSLLGWTLSLTAIAHGGHVVDIKLGHGGPGKVMFEGRELAKFAKGA